MLRFVRLRFLASLAPAAALACACGHTISTTAAGTGGTSTASSTSTKTGVTASATSGNGGAGGASCVLATVPLLLDTSSGALTRIHVPVTFEGAAHAMLLDTGSNATFLDEPLGSPDPVPDAGEVAIGCETRTLIGRPVVPEDPFQGLTNVGTVGVDLLLKGPSKIDFTASVATLHASGAPFPETAAWPNAPFDLDEGLVLPHVSLDGMPVRLMLDTGSPDTLWLGQQPNPGDQEIDTTDAEGNPVKLYLGTVDVTIGTKTLTVPVYRVPSFPYLEKTIQDLGGNIQGLLGLSALGSSGFVIDPDTTVVRIDI